MTRVAIGTHDRPEKRRYHPGVDVVVVNYRTPGDIEAFLRSFQEVQWEVPATLMIVNVEPTDEDIDAVERGLTDGIDVSVGYCLAPNNIGYARACNTAASALIDYGAPRQTVAFFNADTRLRPGVLDHCHWHLHQNDDWAVIGPKQVNDDGRITHAGIFGTREAPVLRGWKQKDDGAYDGLRDDAVSVSGSAYFVKRAVWDELAACPIYQTVAPDAAGAFLPTQHYYEETWFSYHALEHGWKVAYDGDVTMVHRWHQASPIGGFAEREMPKSQKYFRDACDFHGIPHD